MGVRILGVGNATVDIINVLETYPEEDQEYRALAQSVSRGGNTANSLVVLSRLGHECSWAGSLATDHYSRIIRQDLARHGVDLRYIQEVDAGSTPVSCVTLNRKKATRTIVHFRDLPEYSFQQFQRIDLSQFDHLHFEGRAVPQLEKMLQRTFRCNQRPSVSIEIEKPRLGLADLAVRADLVLFSRAYAESLGYVDGDRFLQEQRLQAKGDTRMMLCAWGAQGAYGVDRTGITVFEPAVAPQQAVDTLAAGDVFNAAAIDGFVRRLGLKDVLGRACSLAAKKCSTFGLEFTDAAV